MVVPTRLFARAFSTVLFFGACQPSSNPGRDGVTTDSPSNPLTEDARVQATVVPLASTVLGFAVNVLVEPAAPVTLICVAENDEKDRFVLDSLSSDSHEIQLFGLLAETAYNCSVSVPSTDDAAAFSYTTLAVPFAVPEVEITDNGGRYGSYTLLNHWRKAVRNHRLMIFDAEGRLRWYWLSEAETGGLEATYLGDGLILTGGGKSVNPGTLTLDGVFVDQMPDSSVLLTPEPYHHEATFNPAGDFVGLATTFVDVDGAAVEIFSISAYNPDSQALTFEWSALQAIEAGTFDLGDDLSNPFHANAVQWIVDDVGEAVWVSMKGVSLVARIDPATGDVTHSLGAGGGFQLRDANGPLPSSEWFYGQHAPRFRDNQLLIFNNSRASTTGQSAVELYEIDVAGQTLTRLWKYTRPGWFEPFYGEGDWLPNGNILVVGGHCTGCVAKDGVSFVAEVDPSTSDVVWEMTFVQSVDSIYRADLIDGCDLFHNQRYCSE